MTNPLVDEYILDIDQACWNRRSAQERICLLRAADRARQSCNPSEQQDGPTVSRGTVVYSSFQRSEDVVAALSGNPCDPSPRAVVCHPRFLLFRSIIGCTTTPFGREPLPSCSRVI